MERLGRSPVDPKERLMAKVTKKVCNFLGTDVVLVNETPNKSHAELEQELNSLCRMLQLIIMDGTDLKMYDLGGGVEEDTDLY